MKRVFSRITATILVVGTLGACSPQSETSEQTGTIRVLTPQNNAKAGYSLQVVELLGIEDLQTVSGKFVRFFMSPRIVGESLHGKPAVARFIKNKDGEQIPANEITQQMVTIYAHTQKLAQLDEELGAGGINQWPRDVGIAVRVKGGMNNNAFYDGATDSMLVVPYNQAGLPIAINAGILAHEHFHSLFYKIVLKDLGEAETSLHGLEESGRAARSLPVIEGDKIDEQSMADYYRFAMLRGLNEGLADYWGWMYTGDPDFIARSLPKEKRVRSLEVDDLFANYRLPGKTVVRRNLEVFYGAGDRRKFRDYITGYAYTIGTQFSRVLKRFTEVSAEARALESQDVRKEVAKVIVKLLPTLKSDLAEKKSGDYTASHFVQVFAEKWAELNQAECEFLSEVLDSSADEKNVNYLCRQNESGKFVLEEKVEGAQ